MHGQAACTSAKIGSKHKCRCFFRKSENGSQDEVIPYLVSRFPFVFCYLGLFSSDIIEPDPEPVEEEQEAVIEAAVAEEVTASQQGVWVFLTNAH